MSENKGLSDLEIAHNATILPIEEIAVRAGINVDALELYGPYKAKINPAKLVLPVGKQPGKVVLVSAMSPTPAGEGKSRGRWRGRGGRRSGRAGRALSARPRRRRRRRPRTVAAGRRGR